MVFQCLSTRNTPQILNFNINLMRTFLLLCFVLFTSGLIQAQNYSKDVKMGDKAAQQVGAEMGYYKHDSLELLIKAIGKKLVAALEKKPTEFEFEFNLVDAEEPNAFALPGGHIYVTRGILPLIQNEDELAGIIGHEIMHVIQRHSVKQFNREIVPAVLKVPGNIINAITFSRLGNIINVPIDIIASPFIAKYSRKHEKEADDLGIELAARAGYNPIKLADALDRLSKEIEALTGQAERRSFLSDHPYTPFRSEDIRTRSKTLVIAKYPPVAASQENFLQKFNGLCFGHNPKNGVFVDTLFVQPELGISFILPSGWAKENEKDQVTANHKDKDAAIALSIASNSLSLKQCVEQIQKKLKQSKQANVNFSGDTTLNGMPAYILRMNNTKKGQEIILELIWVEHNHIVYQLEGVCINGKRKATAQALRSFKPMTANERDLVMIYELQVVLSQNNESIEDLSKRTNNKLNPELTLVFNDLDKKTLLTGNKPVKIIKKATYNP
jgi:predicted Zn-dependent protease